MWGKWGMGWTTGSGWIWWIGIGGVSIDFCSQLAIEGTIFEGDWCRMRGVFFRHLNTGCTSLSDKNPFCMRGDIMHDNVNRDGGRGGLRVVPELTGLQFLVVSLLFEGEMTSNALREELMERGYTGSRVAFSRLMGRMIKKAYVTYTFDKEDWVGLGVWERQYRYRVSNLGVIVWKIARDFYLSFEPPADDLDAVEVDAVEFLECDPGQRNKMAVDKLMVEFNANIEREMKKCFG